MDFQNRVGSKTGGGGPAGWSESNRDRKERLRKLALETIDLSKVTTNSWWALFCVKIPCCFTAGSIFYAKSLGHLRVQTVSDSSQH